MYKINLKKNNKREASSLIYIIFMFVMFLTFAAFAIDGTMTWTNRMKLQNITEASALAAAANITDAVNTATTTFNRLSQFNGTDFMTTPAPVIAVNGGRVSVTTSMVSRPIFLAFLGISGINLNARACAESEALPVTANYAPTINWVTRRAAYQSDIVSRVGNFNDTAILLPLGNALSASYSGVNPSFNLIEAGVAGPLSLGPGGFITIKLPTPIVDKPGPDFSITEAGIAREGYMVFAGLDVNPGVPYVQSNNVGAGIMWKNISCLGSSADLGGNAYGTATTSLGVAVQDKFYGSGNFDLNLDNIDPSATCVNPPPSISMVKYIRIVDDNAESAFVLESTNNNYYRTMLFGEASTVTAGADIDSVRVLNHVRLIPGF